MEIYEIMLLVGAIFVLAGAWGAITEYNRRKKFK